MPLGAAEFGAEEIFHALPRDCDPHGAASQAEYIHVVVLHALARGLVIVAKSGTHSDDFISSHRRAHSAAAYQNATVNLSSRYGASERDCKIRLVIIAVVHFISKVHDLMPF